MIGYFIRNEELVEEEFNSSDIKSTDVLCLVDETTKQIFIWYGDNAHAKSRFIAAREGPGLRELYGKHYKMRTVCEEDNDKEFENALNSGIVAKKAMGVDDRYNNKNGTESNTDSAQTEPSITTKDAPIDNPIHHDIPSSSQEAPIGFDCDILIRSMEIYRKSSNGFDKERFVDGQIIEDADAVRIDVQNGEIKSVEILRKV